MAIDPVTQGVRWGAGVFGFFAAMNRNRKANKAERQKRKGKKLTPEQERLLAERGQASPAETEGVSMNQQVITQIALGLVRHAMTATGVGVYLSDDIVVQAVSAVVAIVGAFWMAKRKVKPATTQAS